MKFYKKVGRLSDEEQAVINAIQKVIDEKNIPLNEIPECNSLDDLLEVQLLVEAYEKKQADTSEIKSENTEEVILEDQGIEVEQVEEPIEETETEEVVNESENQSIIEESDNVIENADSLEFVADDYDPFSDEIIERSYNVKTEETKAEETLKVTPLDSDDIELEESRTTPVDDLPSNTKKRAAEQTANAILKGYSRVAPIPFKWLAKVDEQKVEQMVMDGQIDITIEVDNGTTFEDYMRQTNEQVDEIFEVEGETLDEIREPLIEVLMEQELELTPQQRLFMAVISHIGQMLITALQIRKQNNRILQNQMRLMQTRA